MNCIHCGAACAKKGARANGIQRFRCKRCNKYQQQTYRKKAWLPSTNNDIVRFLRESVGIRGISRLSGISPKTVIARIKSMASRIKEPPLSKDKTYEVDELRTFVRHKSRMVWVVCAYERETKKIVRFSVGRRTNKTLKTVLDSLTLSEARAIYTDGLDNYGYLIEKKRHKVTRYGTNRVERTSTPLSVTPKVEHQVKKACPPHHLLQ